MTNVIFYLFFFNEGFPYPPFKVKETGIELGSNTTMCNFKSLSLSLDFFGLGTWISGLSKKDTLILIQNGYWILDKCDVLVITWHYFDLGGHYNVIRMTVDDMRMTNDDSFLACQHIFPPSSQIPDSHWSRQITWPEYWPLIGHKSNPSFEP